MKSFLRSWLWLAIGLIAAVAGVSDSVLNSLCDSQKCVCQINVSPGSNGCQSDESLVQENARMNETIWLLQDEIRRLKDSKDQRDQNPVITVDGARWRAFWWYKKSSGWPRCPDDVLGGEYGSCDPSEPYCFARLPNELSETGAEMLGKDSAGTIYRWAFDATNPTAHAAWKAFHDHIQTPAGSVKNNYIWNPRAVTGKAPDVSQNSFMYRMEHGVVSLLLDDDNCDCKSSLNLGHGMCNAGHSTSYGPENRFGVDLLYDPGCQAPTADNGLTLFFKDDDDCIGVDCGPGLRCRDGLGKYTCVV